MLVPSEKKLKSPKSSEDQIRSEETEGSLSLRNVFVNVWSLRIKYLVKCTGWTSGRKMIIKRTSEKLKISLLRTPDQRRMGRF